ncbi:MAG: hypothetical protein JNN17_08755 [Verrucomicrobiaceae bacterium]|nr:hypothetical protein [Verrucomicrobiaceae bacterium]
MMLRSAICALLIAPAALAAEAKAPDITQNGIQTAFRVLQKEYIRSGDLTFDELNRAALHGLLERLQFGAELVSRTQDAKQADAGGVQAETLRPGIALLRPKAFRKEEIAAIEQHLAKFVKEGAKHLILDLRAPAAPSDFDVAAAMLGLFVPENEVLFKTRQMTDSNTEVLRSDREPLWKASLLVLIDNDTCNVGEAIAAVLRQRKQALLIGAPTRGAAVRYETIPVDANWSLRFARAEVLLPDDSSIFQKGLAPDFPVKLAEKTKRAFFDPDNKTRAATTITDTPRVRFNEAALVAGTNPELDSYIRRSAGEPLPEDQPKPRDTVLQRAVDFLITSDHLQAAKINWSQKLPPEPPAPKAVPVNE